MSSVAKRTVHMLGAQRGAGSCGVDHDDAGAGSRHTGALPDAPNASQFVGDLVESRMNEKLKSVLESNPHARDVLRFELNKAFDNVEKWFVKK